MNTQSQSVNTSQFLPRIPFQDVSPNVMKLAVDLAVSRGAIVNNNLVDVLPCDIQDAYQLIKINQ